MKNYIRLLRYDWPLHFILLLTNWLPDSVIFLRIRGFLAKWFLGSCGKNLRLGRNITFYNSSNVHIGHNVYIALGNWFLASGRIQLDDEVMISPYCVIVDANHVRDKTGSFRYAVGPIGTITIGRGTWVGAHSSVLTNVTIGQNVLVAAGSVVNKDCPSDCTIGGVPAKILKDTW